MARGWESKSVESQKEDLMPRRSHALPMSVEQQATERRRDGLLLQRVRIHREIEVSTNERHRQTLEQGLKFLEDSLAAMGWKK